MFQLLKFLNQRHQITVVAFIFAASELSSAEELKNHCHEVHTILRQKSPINSGDNRPRLIAEYHTQEMVSCLERINAEQEFDLVDIEHVFMAQYAQLVSAPAILQEHNIESNVLKHCARLKDISQGQVYASKSHAFRAFADSEDQWELLEQYETYIWPTFALRTTVSEEDKQAMDRRCTRGKSIVVPNGVSTIDTPWLSEVESQNILFMGTLDYYPNVDGVLYFAETVLPRLWLEEPSAQLFVAGRNPPQEICDLTNDPRIKVVANPSTISQVASNCRLSVVPLRFGGGSRLKILDSLAMGLPVVSSQIGSEGLKLNSQEHLLICDSAQQFAQDILLLFRDQALYEKLRRQGRKAVEALYDWRKIFPDLEAELVSFCASHSTFERPSR